MKKQAFIVCTALCLLFACVAACTPRIPDSDWDGWDDDYTDTPAWNTYDDLVDLLTGYFPGTRYDLSIHQTMRYHLNGAIMHDRSGTMMIKYDNVGGIPKYSVFQDEPQYDVVTDGTNSYCLIFGQELNREDFAAHYSISSFLNLPIQFYDTIKSTSVTETDDAIVYTLIIDGEYRAEIQRQEYSWHESDYVYECADISVAIQTDRQGIWQSMMYETLETISSGDDIYIVYNTHMYTFTSVNQPVAIDYSKLKQ
jgi:hypothetical protein